MFLRSYQFKIVVGGEDGGGGSDDSIVNVGCQGSMGESSSSSVYCGPGDAIK